jgi:hypothetical protein
MATSTPIFDLKHFFFAIACSAVGALCGWVGGIFLYVMILCGDAFAPTSLTQLATLASTAGVFPLILTIIGIIIGLFGGWWLSHVVLGGSGSGTILIPQSSQPDLTSQITELNNNVKQLTAVLKTPEPPPKTT